MAPQATLPPEILSKVLELLPDDQTTLAKCCLISRELQMLATPILYRSVDMTFCKGFAGPSSNYLMFKMITKKPEFARHVHRLQDDMRLADLHTPTFTNDQVVSAARKMNFLRWACLSGSVIGRQVLSSMALYRQLVELSVYN